MRAGGHSGVTRPAVSESAQLPWWALALPVLAFALLLTLLTLGGQSQSESSVTLAVNELLERFRLVLSS